MRFQDWLNRAVLNELGFDNFRLTGGDARPDPAHPVDMDADLLTGRENIIGFELAAVKAQQSEPYRHFGTVGPTDSDRRALLARPLQPWLTIRHVITPPSGKTIRW